VGLFSLFKKGKPDAVDDDDDAAARLAANSETLRQSAHSQLQRDIARATALKIDAIEAAMEADIFADSIAPWGSRPQRPARPPADHCAPTGNPDTLALLDAPTTELLADDGAPAPLVADQSAPLVEETAILYANGQHAVAEQMLAAALADAAAAGAQQDRTVWWMLFDLYQVDNRQDAFDNLSIDYASTFETSPPPWRGPMDTAHSGATAPADAGYTGVAPTQALAATLDDSAEMPLAQLLSVPPGVPLRLDFSRVSCVEPAGCALLLTALRELQKRQRELTVVGAAELAALLRAGLHVGRRDDSETAWLLLLELLQQLNREKEFEETAMDYCVTFEMSPPSFAAPLKVATAARQHATAPSDRFMLPPLMAGDVAPLLEAIDAYAAHYPALVFDCSRLARLDFGAANQLLSRLQPLAAEHRRVEFREVNHLVAALLRLLGYASLARIFAHKY
jgi:ABC-type transporter Mla MlaB component